MVCEKPENEVVQTRNKFVAVWSKRAAELKHDEVDLKRGRLPAMANSLTKKTSALERDLV